MTAEVIDFDQAKAQRTSRPPRISVGLRNVSRECRKEILRTHSYHAFWLGGVSKEQYAELLFAHLKLRQHLESLFHAQGGTFHVSDILSHEHKSFDVDKYVTSRRQKSAQLQQDIDELESLLGVRCDSLPAQARELIQYMDRVEKVYSAALLGILYMLEETVIYAGPGIARVLDQHLQLGGRATHYLRGSSQQKADLWEFRKSLDLITDFQTQANIIIASSITYRIYRDLLDPHPVASPRPGLFH